MARISDTSTGKTVFFLDTSPDVARGLAQRMDWDRHLSEALYDPQNGRLAWSSVPDMHVRIAETVLDSLTAASFRLDAPLAPDRNGPVCGNFVSGRKDHGHGRLTMRPDIALHLQADPEKSAGVPDMAVIVGTEGLTHMHLSWKLTDIRELVIVDRDITGYSVSFLDLNAPPDRQRMTESRLVPGLAPDLIADCLDTALRFEGGIAAHGAVPVSMPQGMGQPMSETWTRAGRDRQWRMKTVMNRIDLHAPRADGPDMDM